MFDKMRNTLQILGFVKNAAFEKHSDRNALNGIEPFSNNLNSVIQRLFKVW